MRRALANDAKWMSIYQAVEQPGNDSREEYGLFSLAGDVRGTRSYGKGPNPAYDNPQPRRAYCEGIYNFAFARKYETATRTESGCDG